MEQISFFESMGEFCVRFEQVCLELENLAEQLLRDAGLKDRDTVSVVLDGLTAAPLQKLVAALYADRLKSEDEKNNYLKCANEVFSAFAELTELRNKIIHTKWVEPNSNPNFGRQDGKILGRKIKSNSKGNATLYPSVDTAQFDRAIECCKKTEFLVGRISYVFSLRSLHEASKLEIIKQAKQLRSEIKNGSRRFE